MAHLLAMDDRDPADDAEELVLLKPIKDIPAEVSMELKNLSVPSDAAFVKYLAPRFISCNGSRPSFMWAGKEFETARSGSIFPAYFVGGFGLLDACLHAYATNATLALHPLDIILTVCYAYGTQRKRTIYSNNIELQKCNQIVLRSEFTRSNLLLALTARLARRVETFPLPKLYGLINTELSSPDPFVMRLAISVLSFLATTRETTKNTLDTFKSLSDIREQKTMEELLESRSDVKIVPMGMLDIRHDANSPSWRKPTAKDANNQQAAAAAAAASSEKGARGDPETAVAAVSSADRHHRNRGAETSARRNRDAPPEQSAALVAQSNASDNMKVLGSWKLTFDSNTADEVGEKRAGQELAASNMEPPSAPDALSIVSSEAVDNSSMPQQEAQQRNLNNATLSSEQEADEWLLRLPRTPARVYRLNQGCGIHSVLLKGNQRAWLELPEVLHELCQFFGVESNLREKIIRVALNLQMTRLNFNDECKKWWPGILFKDARPENPLQDGDICITGWLGTLLGERMISHYGPVTINHLAGLKIAVKLPVLLVRLPETCTEDSDDVVLDPDVGLRRTRLNYYDEYRERLVVNSSSNASEIPIGLFLPWRSCDALNRTRRLWRQGGGDTPSAVAAARGAARSRVSEVVNRSNAETHTYAVGGAVMYSEERVIKKWTSMREGSAGARGSCSCCGGRRRNQKGQSEPLYNMSCLVTGMGGFCLQTARLDTGGESTSRTCVRPLCFVDLVYQS